MLYIYIINRNSQIINSFLKLENYGVTNPPYSYMQIAELKWYFCNNYIIFMNRFEQKVSFMN